MQLVEQNLTTIFFLQSIEVWERLEICKFGKKVLQLSSRKIKNIEVMEELVLGQKFATSFTIAKS